MPVIIFCADTRWSLGTLIVISCCIVDLHIINVNCVCISVIKSLDDRCLCQAFRIKTRGSPVDLTSPTNELKGNVTRTHF